MKIKSKQLENNTITQDKLNLSTISVIDPTDVTTKGYVDNLVNSAFTSITNNLSNLHMTTLATTSGNGYMLACNTGILYQPLSVVSILINGVEVNTGIGLDCAFSGDNGATFRTSGSEMIGDKLYWNTNTAPYQLDSDDEVDFAYLTKFSTPVASAFSFDVLVLDNDTITLPTAEFYYLYPDYTKTPAAYDAVVDWGDNTTTNLTAYNVGREHTYTTAGTYTVSITGTMDVFSTIDSDNLMISGKIVNLISCGNINIKNLSFDNCAGLTNIPTDFFKYNTSLIQLEYCFRGCSSITSIPADIFKYNTGVQNLEGCFSNISITSIPNDLFKYNTNIINFSGCFSNCVNLTSIPVDIFKYNTLVENFSGCFSNCVNLTSIPVDIFKYNTLVENFSGCFINCVNLTSIPVDIFKYNTLVENFSYIFSTCGNLTTIPETLFSTNINVTYISGGFSNCVNLTTIPETLFLNNTSIIDMGACFDGCKSLSSIPSGLFTTNTAITSFGSCFGSTQITTIPSTLFSTNTLATDFQQTFCGCINLTAIPTNLFTFNLNVENFISCFQSCTSLDGNAPELWVIHPTATGTNCFNGDTLLDNYASIPAGWK